jgi:molybdate transport system ATP-binding protein
MMIEFDVKHRLGALTLEAQFTAGRGLVALFGRSGSGKTSIINIIAGLMRPDRGRVIVDNNVLVDTDRGIFLPPHRRRLGYVFQEGRLFPHLTVRQNLLYGAWFARTTKNGSELSRVVELLGIGGLLDRRPGLLSGGEKQRVAIGRALFASPRLLLMDEPLAALDEARKDEILPYIERLRDDAKVPIIYVSHSISEVARLANLTVLLSGGKVVAAGPPAEIMQRLDLTKAAGDEEAGALIEAVVEEHDDTNSLTRLVSRAGTWRVPRLHAEAGKLLRMRIKARDVMIALEAPEGMSALNIIPGIVSEVGLSDGPAIEIKLDCHGEALVARLTRYSAGHLALQPGKTVFAIIKSVAFDRNNLGGEWPATRTADADAGQE